MPKQACYKVKLFAYRKVNKFKEEEVSMNFYPAKINGFAMLLDKVIRVKRDK